MGAAAHQQLGDLVAKQLQAYNVQLEQFHKDLSTLSADFGKYVLPQTTSLIKLLDTWTVKLDTLIKNNPALVSMLVKVTEGFAAFLIVGGAMAVTFGAISLAAGAIFSPAGLIMLGLLALSAAATYVAAHWSTVKTVIGEVWQGVDEFWKMLKAGFEAIKTPIAAFFHWLASLVPHLPGGAPAGDSGMKLGVTGAGPGVPGFNIPHIPWPFTLNDPNRLKNWTNPNLGAPSKGPSQLTSYNFGDINIAIHQQPGEDGNKLADRVITLLTNKIHNSRGCPEIS